MENDWTENEFKAYLLLYAAHANFEESKAEIDFIKQRVGKKNLAHIHVEFDEDNDYQHIQKIQACVKRFAYKTEDIETLFSDMKALFVTDGRMDVLEQNLFLGLKHVLFP